MCVHKWQLSPDPDKRQSSQSATPRRLTVIHRFSFYYQVIGCRKRSTRREHLMIEHAVNDSAHSDDSRGGTPLTSWRSFYYLNWINQLSSLCAVTAARPNAFFLYATTFINRLIRTAVGVRIMCCSVTDSEWLPVLAHRGGDSGMLCTWRALCISAVHTSMHLITNSGLK